MKTEKALLTAFILANCYCQVFSQFDKVEHITLFGSRIDNPVEVEVTTSGNNYVFTADNRSYYPYILELKIMDIVNLNPPRVNGFFKIHPGKNKLVTLSVVNPEQPSYYSYSTSYSIGIPSQDVDFDLPYLMPFKGPFDFEKTGDDTMLIKANTFRLHSGDTIFAMRRGMVAATPDMDYKNDRVSERNSLEIIHQDGTIMVYENLDPDQVLIKPGKQVYPGEAMGIIKGNAPLEVMLYLNLGGGKLRGIQIKYCIDKNTTEIFSSKLREATISYPREIIVKEMTKREVKRYDKGIL